MHFLSETCSDTLSTRSGLSNPVDSVGPTAPMTTVREGTEVVDSDDEGIGPATIAALTRGRLIDARRVPEVEAVNTGNVVKPVTTGIPTKPMTAKMGTMPGLPSQPAPLGRKGPTIPIPPQPLGPPPSSRPPVPGVTTEERVTPTVSATKPRGLRTTARRMPEISNPIPRNSQTLDERVAANAFERPRPAPLVLQGANDREPVAPSRF